MAKITIEKFKTIHQEWRQSGLGVREYCANIGMNEDTFHYWKRKVEDEQDARGCGAFIPVRLRGGKHGGMEARMHGSGNSALCEVVYPNGVTVRVTSDMTFEQLRRMITLFR